jgi:hypothetical protein
MGVGHTALATLCSRKVEPVTIERVLVIVLLVILVVFLATRLL